MEPEDHNEENESEDGPGAASLTDLNVARHRSKLASEDGGKSGDITDQLAQIKLPGEGGPAAPPPLRAVREFDAADAPPPPSEDIRPTEQLRSAAEDAAASRESNDMAHAETQQDLLAMMDRISAGLADDPGSVSAAPPPPPPAPSAAPPVREPAPAPEPPPPAAAPAPEPPPQAPPQAAAPAPEPPPPAEPEPPKQEPLSRLPQGLVKYWMSLTNGRKYPSWSDFESSTIAEHWPNSMILTCSQPDGRDDITISKVTRIADQNVTPPTGGSSRVEYTPMLTEWILSKGKEAGRSGRPMQESDRFPTNEGIVRYQMILLPLSDEQNGIDHVLCHVYRA